MFWLAAATLLLAGVPPAAAHFDAAGRYTHGRCPATPSTRVDPVNVVFTGWGTWGRAVVQRARRRPSRCSSRSVGGFRRINLDQCFAEVSGRVLAKNDFVDQPGFAGSSSQERHEECKPN